MYYSMLHLVVCQLDVLLKKHKFSIALEVSTKACSLQVIQCSLLLSLCAVVVCDSLFYHQGLFIHELYNKRKYV